MEVDVSKKKSGSFVWLSASGAPPVYMERILLTESVPDSWFAKVFGGRMTKPLPRLPAPLEQRYAGGEPVYVINVPSQILDAMLDILRQPMVINAHYMSNAPPNVDMVVWKAYVEYFGLQIEASQQIATERDIVAFEHACHSLITRLKVAIHIEGVKNQLPCSFDFLMTPSDSQRGEFVAPTDTMIIDNCKVATALYFGPLASSLGAKGKRGLSVLSNSSCLLFSKHGDLRALVKAEFLSQEVTKTQFWPARMHIVDLTRQVCLRLTFSL